MNRTGTMVHPVKSKEAIEGSEKFAPDVPGDASAIMKERQVDIVLIDGPILAKQSAELYHQLLDAIHQRTLDANVSVKLLPAPTTL